MDFEKELENYNYYNEHIVDFCLGKDDNFITKPFQEFNRIEIDLSSPANFFEKLEIKLHLKRAPVYTSVVRSIRPKD